MNNGFTYAEPHLPNRRLIEVPLLKQLIKLGGAPRFSEVGRILEINLAEEFGLTEEERDFSAPNYHSEGNRKWRNHIQFVRDQLVKKSELDNSVRDVWRVTLLGYRRIGLLP